MSDERQAFEQLHAIPSGAEWCEKRHIYIHKNYSGLVLHPINESWEAFCEGALWQASREEGEPIGEVGYMIQPNWDDPSKTKGVALVDKSLAPGTKLYTHPASAAKQAVSVPSILYDGYAVFQEVQHDRNSKGLKNIKDSALVSDVLDAVVKLIKQEKDRGYKNDKN